MFIVKSLLLILLFCSCSSTRDQATLGQVPDEFISSFNVDDDLSKFQEQKKTETVSGKTDLTTMKNEKKVESKSDKTAVENPFSEEQEKLKKSFVERDPISKKLFIKMN